MSKVTKQQAVATAETIFGAFREHDGIAGGAGESLLRWSIQFACDTPKDVWHAATNRALVGVEPKTSDAVRLSQIRGICRAVVAVGAEAVANATYRLEPGRAFRVYMAAVSALNKAHAEEEREERAESDAREVAEKAAKADPRIVAADLVNALRDARSQAALEAKAERETPEYRAREFMKRAITKFGEAFTREMVACMAAEFEAVAEEARAK